jgi:hypothetical protein
MNDPEVTMPDAYRTNDLVVTRTALDAATAAISDSARNLLVRPSSKHW